jgi:hypothetical protein
MDELPESCLRQTGEPNKLYNLFKIYLELGLRRTLNRVAEITGVPLRSIKRYSGNWRWVRRSGKYDEWRLEQSQIELRKSIDSNSIGQFDQKMELAGLTNTIITSLIASLNSFSTQFDNPEIIKRTRYIKSITAAIIDLQKILHFSVKSDLINIKLKSDLGDINSLILQQNPNDSFIEDDLEKLNRLLINVNKSI